jgi:two-component sensor histidine kinase
VNELLTNAVKYAFVGREGGSISVSARAAGGNIRIEVADDGVGLPEGLGFGASSGSLASPGFGLSLAASLAKLLGGTIRAERGGGTRIILEFQGPAITY